MIFVGIDPGLDGGVSSLWDDEVQVCRVPLVPQTSARREYDLKAMRALVNFDKEQTFATLEKQQAFHGQGVVSTGSIMRGFGLWEGILTGLGIDYMVVRPQKWQKEMIPGKAGETKQRSIAMAKRLFPGTSLRVSSRGKNDHHGMSDALLISEYGRRTYKFHQAISDKIDKALDPLEYLEFKTTKEKA